MAPDPRGAGRNQFILTNDTVEVVGDVAWVTCDENLVAPGSTFTVAATNVFVRDPARAGSWSTITDSGRRLTRRRRRTTNAPRPRR